MMDNDIRYAEILLVEDNLGDVELCRDAFEDAKFINNLNVARDGQEALDYLLKRNGFENSKRPDVILLDLNLPKYSGHEVLEFIKNRDDLKTIPTIILTSSADNNDITSSYNRHANCHIVKPVNAQKFIDVVQKIENFWISVVCLPMNEE